MQIQCSLSAAVLGALLSLVWTIVGSQPFHLPSSRRYGRWDSYGGGGFGGGGFGGGFGGMGGGFGGGGASGSW